jgi:hypothetical protein
LHDSSKPIDGSAWSAWSAKDGLQAPRMTWAGYVLADLLLQRRGDVDLGGRAEALIGQCGFDASAGAG